MDTWTGVPPRRYVTRKGVVIETTLTDAQAIQTLNGLSGDFAANLRLGLTRYGALTPDQLAWAHKLAMDKLAPAPAPIAVGDMGRILALFATAKLKLKFPKIRLALGSSPICLSVAGARSRVPGSIHVTDGGKFGQSRFYGSISPEGGFRPNASAPVGLAAFLQTFAADPEAIATRYGTLTGNCSFCNLTLTDTRSTQVGYGPVCAQNWGLFYPTKLEANENGHLRLNRPALA